MGSEDGKGAGAQRVSVHRCVSHGGDAMANTYIWVNIISITVLVLGVLLCLKGRK